MRAGHGNPSATAATAASVELSIIVELPLGTPMKQYGLHANGVTCVISVDAESSASPLATSKHVRCGPSLPCSLPGTYRLRHTKLKEQYPKPAPLHDI